MGSDKKVMVNLTEIVKIIIFTVMLLGFGIPAIIYVYKTYDKINFVFDAFYEAATPEQKARIKR